MLLDMTSCSCAGVAISHYYNYCPSAESNAYVWYLICVTFGLRDQ